MLVLTRAPGESIEIDGPCVIKFLEVRGNRVRVGVEADLQVNIKRSGAKSGPKLRGKPASKAA
jgi:carbon storage regulator CsrA